jgi:hypothetical protein
MTDAICAICQQEFNECTNSIHVNCDCKETFTCCSNSYHSKCIFKLFNSQLITTIMRIAKCPLCRKYIEQDSKIVMTSNDYITELEESIIDYDLQVHSYKNKVDESNEKHLKLIDLCDDIMETNNKKVINLMEEHAKDIEDMKSIREQLAHNLRLALDTMKHLLEENKSQRCEIAILEAEKDGIKSLIQKKNSTIYDSNSVIDILTTTKLNKEIQTEVSDEDLLKGVAC